MFAFVSAHYEILRSIYNVSNLAADYLLLFELFTILASYSQEESRSISENTKWGVRKRFAQGEYRMPYAYFLGYDKGMEINKEQAILVRKIYRMYLQGYSCHKIKKNFEENDIPTVSGKNHWYNTVIKSILQNEKYKGDALLQKTYIADFTTHLKVKNTGELPQYYITADHEAIISPFVFDLVQDKYKRRINMFTSGKSPLSGKILCGCCGQVYGPYVWHSTSSRSKRVWKCPSFRKDIPNCNNTFINETALFESVLKVWKHFLRTDKYAVKLCELILEKNININSYIRKADILDFDDFLLLLDRIIIKDNLLTFIFIDNSTYKVKFQNIKRYKRK